MTEQRCSLPSRAAADCSKLPAILSLHTAGMSVSGERGSTHLFTPARRGNMHLFFRGCGAADLGWIRNCGFVYRILIPGGGLESWRQRTPAPPFRVAGKALADRGATRRRQAAGRLRQRRTVRHWGKGAWVLGFAHPRSQPCRILRLLTTTRCPPRCSRIR
jgi:hypothetical protein